MHEDDSVLMVLAFGQFLTTLSMESNEPVATPFAATIALGLLALATAYIGVKTHFGCARAIPRV